MSGYFHKADCGCHVCAGAGRTLEQRFWEKVEKRGPDECWEWLATKDSQMGYGMFSQDGWMPRAHRVAWELTYGPIPDGLCVCHRCDNPPCCNPAHLWLGTKTENTHDRDRKGRHRPLIGEASPRAKLTEEDVLQIRALTEAGRTRRQLALRFGISTSQVQRIVHRETWSHA